jgi:hypothetical protein
MRCRAESRAEETGPGDWVLVGSKKILHFLMPNAQSLMPISMQFPKPLIKFLNNLTK